MKETTKPEQSANIKWIEKDGRWGYETPSGAFVACVSDEVKEPVAFRTNLKLIADMLSEAPNLRNDVDEGLISFTVCAGNIRFNYSEAWFWKQDELLWQQVERLFGDGCVTVSAGQRQQATALVVSRGLNPRIVEAQPRP